VYIDKELLNEDIITFHPNDNTATVFIKIKDMFKFIDNLGFAYEIIDM
jgi:Ala-tRNA(Pro) deacylase